MGDKCIFKLIIKCMCKKRGCFKRKYYEFVDIVLSQYETMVTTKSLKQKGIKYTSQ